MAMYLDHVFLSQLQLASTTLFHISSAGWEGGLGGLGALVSGPSPNKPYRRGRK